MAMKIDIAGTNISASQMSEFFRLATLLGSHVDRKTFQAFLERRNPFPFVPIPDVFRLAVDYGQSLEQMIVDGHYDLKSSPLTRTEHFPIEGDGIVEFEARYFHFGRNISSDDAVKAIEYADVENPWSPAKIEHLLSHGGTYPDEQCKFLIQGLGSMVDIFDSRSAPCLDKDSYGRRRLHLCNAGGFSNFRFLAVRKVPVI